MVVVRNTTKRREFWGWFGSMVWLFFMVNGIQGFNIETAFFDRNAIIPVPFVLKGAQGADIETAFFEGNVFIPVFFALVFMCSIIVIGLKYGKNPDGLAELAHITAPVSIVIMAIFAFLPGTAGEALFVVSPVFFAPVIVRRVYGVLQTSAPGERITRYMGGIAICIAAFTVCMLITPPKEIAFLIPAILSLPAWIGIRRPISLPKALPAKGVFQKSAQHILIIAAAVVSLCWLNLMNNIIHSTIVSEGILKANPMYIILGFALPIVGFMVYGVAHDKGYERIGFMCGMGLCVVGLLLALQPGETLRDILPLLAFTDGLGGKYTEFFILTIPVFFFIGARRPVFAATLGVVASLASHAAIYVYINLRYDLYIELDTSVLLSAAISAIIFIILVFTIFDRHRETTLAAALCALLRSESDRARAEAAASEGGPQGPGPVGDPYAQAGGAPYAQATGGGSYTAAASPEPSLPDPGFSDAERKIALLLIEGNTRSDILRKLHMSASEVGQCEKAIRKKILTMGDPDPLVAGAIDKYRLTRREAEILRCLRRHMTNPEIAAELFISDATVKYHVRNLLAKLDIETRHQLPAWAAEFVV